jgi:hypothetical protein
LVYPEPISSQRFSQQKLKNGGRLSGEGLDRMKTRPTSTLNENEKRGIVQAYKTLVKAIRRDAASPATKAAFEAFQWTYLGDSRTYVDMFPEPDRRANWIGQLDIYLHAQIEPHFW